MPRRAPTLVAFVLAVALGSAAPTLRAKPAPTAPAAQLSNDARHAVSWIVSIGENQGRPFVVVDKREARLHLFDATGSWVGDTPVLLGQTVGDTDTAAAGGRAPAMLGPSERTTPAGRFESVPGHNDKGEAVVWFDHAAGLAIHRLRPAPPQQRRPARMGSASPEEHRISLGCIVVPVAFYEAFVAPRFGRQRGVVYVLPETYPAQALFGAFDVGLAAF